MFIQTEATPNPATLKFLPGQTVVDNGSYDFRSIKDAEKSPLALRLFDVKDVTGVFLGYDFVTVTKNDDADAMEWQHLKPAILGSIMEHYQSGDPVLEGPQNPGGDLGEEFFEPEDKKNRRVDQGTARDPGSPSGGTRWWRYRISRLQRRRCLFAYAWGLCRLPFLNSNAETRHPKSIAPFHT